MKKHLPKIIVLLLFVGSLAVLSSTIGWHTADAGGGTVASTNYRISGTIGQLDAAPEMKSSTFRIQGGFWVLPVAVQSPGGPTLFIKPDSPGYARIWWFPPKPGFHLQYSDDLTSAAWTDSVSGVTNPVVVPATYPVRYYRLSNAQR